MSTAKHRAYRKVLSIENTSYTTGQVTVPVKIVLWCIPEAYTSRTVKTKHIMFSVYVNGSLKNWGIDGWYPRKPVSINLKNPLSSKFFKEVYVKSTRDKAFTDAFRSYTDTLKNLTGKVLYFNKNSGEGMIHCLELDQNFMLYACNFPNSKTGYPETSCVYVERDQFIKFNLNHGFVLPVDPGLFDEDKWNSLDQDRLAFKRGPDGKFINGLF